MRKLTPLLVAASFVFLFAESALALYIKYEYSAQFNAHESHLAATEGTIGTATLTATAQYPGAPSSTYVESDEAWVNYDLTSVSLVLSGTDYDDEYIPASLDAVELVNVYSETEKDSINIFPGNFNTIPAYEYFRFEPMLFMTPNFFPGTEIPTQQTFTITDVDENDSLIRYLDPYFTVPWTANVTLTVTVVSEPVPEPTTMLLLGTGLVGLAGLRRRFKKS